MIVVYDKTTSYLVRLGNASAKFWNRASPAQDAYTSARNIIMPDLVNNFPIFPFLLAVALAGHGLRKKSLSPSGALAAFIIGFLMLSSQLRTFGVSLLVFYLIGSRATKIGKNLKESFEEGHTEAGYRTASQVLSNSFTAFIASVIWSALFSKDSATSAIFSPIIPMEGISYDSKRWCAFSEPSASWSRFLLFVNLG